MPPKPKLTDKCRGIPSRQGMLHLWVFWIAYIALLGPNTTVQGSVSEWGFMFLATDGLSPAAKAARNQRQTELEQAETDRHGGQHPIYKMNCIKHVQDVFYIHTRQGGSCPEAWYRKRAAGGLKVLSRACLTLSRELVRGDGGCGWSQALVAWHTHNRAESCQNNNNHTLWVQHVMPSFDPL